MAAKMFVVGLGAFIVIFFRHLTGSGALVLKFTPKKCTTGIDNVVEISCLPGGEDDKDKEILVLEISRNNQPPIAVLRHVQNISYGNEISSDFQAGGLIDAQFGRSYLNVSLKYPRSEDTGVYTCTMHYLDKTFRMTDQSVTGNLVVEKLDVETLEIVLNTIKERTTALEIRERENSLQLEGLDKTGSENYEAMVDRVRRLEENVYNLTKNNGSSGSAAFSATTTSAFTLTNGQIIVFPKVVMMEGQGYDASTGVFKAPRDGFYVFHLTAMMYNTGGSKIWIAIEANDNVLAKLLAGDNNSQDQSSISCVVHLVAGDQVRAKVVGTTGGGKLYYDHYTLFSGYLLHSQ